MKYLITLLLLSIITTAVHAQFADSAQLNDYIRNEIRDKKPNKITAEELQKAILGVSGAANSNIKNQYSAKQTANAWLDSIKALNVIADSLRMINNITGRVGLNFSPNKPQYIITDAYHTNLGLSNPVGDYGLGVGPLVSINGRGDSLPFIRRAPLLYAGHTLRDTGTTVWGRNKVYHEPTVHFNKAYAPKSANTDYTIYSNEWFTWAALKSSLTFGLTNKNPNDTTTFITGTHWSAPTNHFMYTDFNNGAVYKHTGWLVNSSSYFQVTTAAGSKWDKLVDYFAGGYSSGLSGNVNATYAFYAHDRGLNTTQRPWGIYIEGAARRNYIQGNLMIGDTTVANAGDKKLYVKGKAELTDSATIDGVTFSNYVSGTIKRTWITTNDNQRDIILTTLDPADATNTGGTLTLRGGSSQATEKGGIEGSFRTKTNANASFKVWEVSNTGVYTRKFEIHKDWTHVANRLTLADVINLPAKTAPASSADPIGANGDLMRDANGNLYLKANGQWLKFTGVTF